MMKRRDTASYASAVGVRTVANVNGSPGSRFAAAAGFPAGVTGAIDSGTFGEAVTGDAEVRTDGGAAGGMPVVPGGVAATDAGGVTTGVGVTELDAAGADAGPLNVRGGLAVRPDGGSVAAGAGVSAGVGVTGAAVAAAAPGVTVTADEDDPGAPAAPAAADVGASAADEDADALSPDHSGSARTLAKSSLVAASVGTPRSSRRFSITSASPGRPLILCARASSNINSASPVRPLRYAIHARSWNASKSLRDCASIAAARQLGASAHAGGDCWSARRRRRNEAASTPTCYQPRRPQLSRRATIGSIRVARRAGM